MSALAERLEALEGKFDTLIELVSRNNDLMQGKLESVTKPYLDDDDMIKLFGWKKTKSRNHKKKLAWLRRQGHLSRFGSMKPFTYDRIEAQNVARQVHSGVLFIPRV
ncbi:MAG: hypothetical protein AAFN65_03875 [Bacteroidota bacterium]